MKDVRPESPVKAVCGRDAALVAAKAGRIRCHEPELGGRKGKTILLFSRMIEVASKVF